MSILWVLQAGLLCTTVSALGQHHLTPSVFEGNSVVHQDCSVLSFRDVGGLHRRSALSDLERISLQYHSMYNRIRLVCDMKLDPLNWL